MALLEVLAKIEAENGSGLARIIHCSIVKMATYQMLHLVHLTVQHALCEVERSEILLARRAKILVQDLLTIEHKLLQEQGREQLDLLRRIIRRLFANKSVLVGQGCLLHLLVLES